MDKAETADWCPAAAQKGAPALRALLAASGLAIILSTQDVPPAVAQSTGPALMRTEAERKLEAGREALQNAEQRRQALQADVAELGRERERITALLMQTARAIQASEGRMTEIESRLGELEAQEKMVRGSLEARHGSISQLLGAMQRMGRNPPPVIVTKREDALDMVRSAMLLARAFPGLKSQADELAQKLGELIRVMTSIKSEGDRLKAETARLSEARIRLAGLIEFKKQTLAERQQELEEVRRTADQIARDVTELGDLIVRLDKAVRDKTTLGAYDREIEQGTPAMRGTQGEDAAASGEVALRPTAPPDSVKGAASGKADGRTEVAMVAPKTGPAVQLEPPNAQSASPGRLKPAVPFHLAKGQLPLPAQGRVRTTFGDRTTFGSSKGIVIETRQGAQVTSPCDGWVVYAGQFRNYGQVLIINAGGGYHVFMTGLSNVDVQVGQFVLAAEPVGTMPVHPQAKVQDNAPVLYVEFRNKEGQSIDPGPWWTKAAS